MFHPLILAFTHDPTRMLPHSWTHRQADMAPCSLCLNPGHIYTSLKFLLTLFLGMEMGDEGQEVPFLPLED